MDLVLLLIGKSCFAAVGLAVGCSLLRQVKAEGRFGLPGLASGAIFVGGLGLILVPVGVGIGDPQIGWWTTMTGEVAMRSGMILLAIFVWRVFRPEGASGALAAAACSAALVGALLWDLYSQEHWRIYSLTLPSAYANQLAIALPLAWSSGESFASWRRQKKQLRLGLGDPDVCTRFAIWTIATLAFVGICLLAIVSGIATHLDLGRLASLAQIGRAGLYLVVSGGIWLGMFPPAFLRARTDRV